VLHGTEGGTVSLCVLHNEQDGRLLLGSRQLSPGEFALLKRAQDVLAAARQEASLARAQTEQWRDMHRSDGFAEGHAQGRLEGVAAVLGSVALASRMQALLTEQLSDIVTQCLHSLLGSQPADELFAHRVRQVVIQAAPAGEVRLLVHPRQAAQAQEVLAELRRAHGWLPEGMRVHANERCAPGLITLETQVGFVDASVELTLESARQALSRALAGVDVLLPGGAACAPACGDDDADA
jgi:type III secretion system HrpE/YscL family protein